MDIIERMDEVKEELEAMVEGAGDNLDFVDFLHRMALVTIFYEREGKRLDFRRDMLENFKLMFSEERKAKGDKYMVIVRNEISSVSKRVNKSIDINIDNNVDASFKTIISNDGRIYCSNYKGRKAKVIIYEEEDNEEDNENNK